MASRKALMDIERNPRLRKAWIAYLETLGLDRAYEMATKGNVDVKFSVKQFIDRMTRNEVRLFAEHYKVYVKLHDNLMLRALDKVQVKHGLDDAQAKIRLNTDSAYEDEVYATIYAQSDWAGLMKDTMQGILTKLNGLASGKFRESNQFRAYLKGAINPKALAAEMDLVEFEVDQILDMATAVAAGDQGRADRSSRQIADNHKPKKGKMMSPAQIAKAMTGAMRKFKMF